MSISTLERPPRIRGLRREKAQQLHVLVERVADEAGLLPSDIYGPSQDSYAVAYRRALWWCFREGYGMTLADIGRVFTGRAGEYSHTSVMAGIRKVREVKLEEWSERKGTWVIGGTEFPSGEVRIREALQTVAEIWNHLNPSNQLRTWRNTA